MEGIIGEAKAMEAEAVTGETDAQTAYETFVKDTNDSITEKTKDIVNKSEMKAKAESGKVEKTAAKESVEEDLEILANENAILHKDCDFTLKNFDLRQGARDDEIEALKQAINIFSGASFLSLPAEILKPIQHYFIEVECTLWASRECECIQEVP